MEVIILLFISLYIVKFLWTWMKVFFIMLGTGHTGSSLGYTIAYLIGKNELQDVLNRGN